MMSTLLLVQLGFNVLMLVALLLVLRHLATQQSPSTRELSARKQQQKRAAAEPARSEPVSGQALKELIDRAEDEELDAERLLKSRLARYRERVGA
jgi:hypothetical protein